MSDTQITISPIDGKAVVERQLLNGGVHDLVARAVDAQKKWRCVALDQRIDIIKRFLDEFESEGPKLAEELTLHMGRPKRFATGEINGFLDRARYLISVARSELSDVELKETDKPGFRRFIRKEPAGVCLCIAAWNYPYLIQVNSLIPALLAGNVVILKPSPQTPTTSEHLARLLESSGLPPNVCQVVHVDQKTLASLVEHDQVDWVSFTGSVENGALVDRVARGPDGRAFKSVVLELGGKDPAYVREDADPEWCATEIADGAFFNSGQSCCAIERVYVHEKLYDSFVAHLAKVAESHVLGDPRDDATTLGPVISKRAAASIRKQVRDAIAQGAKQLVPIPSTSLDRDDSLYVAAQVLVNVDHSMKVMVDETFGPIVGVMKVTSDEEAIKLMNDSEFGLTASVWTHDEQTFEKISKEIEAGTVFMNRCDSLDPALAWTGRKHSGRGVSLSKFGYDMVTKLKSIHIKKAPE